jgi:GTPase SAR1 family protein
MITVITGLTGSGKTWLMTRLMLKDYQAGAEIFANFPLYFPNDNERVSRWHNLDELYNLNGGVIAIDEGQKLFDARRWGSLPVSFSEKIAQHRKHFLDIYTTTQDIGHIDLRVRSNIHELYNCQSVFRWPRNDRVKPILQIIRITKKRRKLSDGDRLIWERINSRLKFISRFWTKDLYNTYGDIGFEKYLCKIKREKNKWTAKIYSRQLVNNGKARL